MQLCLGRLHSPSLHAMVSGTPHAAWRIAGELRVLLQHLPICKSATQRPFWIPSSFISSGTLRHMKRRCDKAWCRSKGRHDAITNMRVGRAESAACLLLQVLAAWRYLVSSLDIHACVCSASSHRAVVTLNDLRWELLKSAMVDSQTANAEHWNKCLARSYKRKDAALQYVAFDQYLEPGCLPKGVSCVFLSYLLI